MSQYCTCDTPPDHKSMTNDESRAVVITGNQSGPVQGRNVTTGMCGFRMSSSRSLGLSKHRFKVLVIAQEYSFETQLQLISALVVLHNFICFYDPTDLPDEDLDEEEPTPQDSTNSNLHKQALCNEEQEQAAECRESIALAMWEDYRHR